MKLSIILTVYNKELYLRRALDSLLNQDDVADDDYEILIVNDGSTDGSASIIDEYTHCESKIRVITEENQGLSIARNNGTHEASGDYIWYVDADDMVSSQSVKLICEAIKYNPDIIPIYAQTFGESKIRNQINPNIKNGRAVLLDKHWEHCGVFWIMRKSFLLDTGLSFFPGIYHEDSEFTPQMLFEAQSVKVIPHILYTIYRDPDSITQKPRPKRAFDCLIVAEHLNLFVEKKKIRGTQIGRIIDTTASVIINNGLSIICQNSKEEQTHFNKVFSLKPELLEPLKNASNLKYRIEAYLFKLLPGYNTYIYITLMAVYNINCIFKQTLFSRNRKYCQKKN